jgi:radical SAM protein with 4Fe4S-binding SPASM domain
MDEKMFLAETIVFYVDDKFYKLSDSKVYTVNHYGKKIIKNLELGASFEELVHKMDIGTKIDREKLASFIYMLEKNGIVQYGVSKGFVVSKKHHRKSPYLNRLFIETTKKCNLKCVHCYVEGGENCSNNELTTEEIITLINEFDDMGGLQVDFTGGEFFIRKDAFQLLECSVRHNMFTNIFTNGTLIELETAKRLKKIGNIRMVYISLDNDNEIQHDKFRGKEGSFKKTVSAIEYLKQCGINVTINVTINSSNHNRIGEIANFFNDRLQTPCRVAPVLSVGRGQNIAEQLTLEEISEAISVWSKASGINEKDLLHNYSNPLIDEKNVIYGPDCGVGNNMLFIKSNGEVCLCPTLSSEQSSHFVFGNIRNNTIKDIWYSNEKIRDFGRASCTDYCSKAFLCKGGCRSRAWILTGDIKGNDPLPCYHLGKNHLL